MEVRNQYKKSKVLIFGSKSHRNLYITSKWYLCEELLQNVDEYVYLGITFHYSGRFKAAQRRLYVKALGAYHSIFKNFSNLDSVPVKVLLKLFSALVSPILLYCSEVWRVHLLGRLTNIEMISDIEKLHIKFCKRILDVHAKSTNLAVIAELGRYPIIIQISTLVIKYWLRINSSMNEKAARICVQSKYPILNSVILLEMCNFSFLKNAAIWKESDINNVAKSIKNDLCEKFTITWKDQIQQYRKLQVFKLVKPSIQFEKYLSQVKIVKHHQAMTRFRISAHRLPIETGRYVNIEHNLRLCPICNLHEVGDEYHYFLCCNNKKLEKLVQIIANSVL